MRDNLKESLFLFFIHRIPLVMTILLMLFFYMPIKSMELYYLRPAIGIICVYYWTLKRGYLFSYISAFWIGLIMDIYSSTPLGMNILMMMLLVWVTGWLTKYFKGSSFSATWMVFASVSLLITFVKWLVFSIYFKQFAPIAEILLNLLSTIMFYPLIAYINILIQNSLLPQERINE